MDKKTCGASYGWPTRHMLRDDDISMGAVAARGAPASRKQRFRMGSFVLNTTSAR